MSAQDRRDGGMDGGRLLIAPLAGLCGLHAGWSETSFVRAGEM
jgi:hypothetical protein